MNKKRFAALLTAAAMLLNVTPVFAAGTASGSGTTTGDGSTLGLDTEIYEVTLPTSNALNFVVDPLGLSSLASGASISMDELGGGAIVAASGSGALIKNNSSVPVTVSLQTYATVTSSAGITLNLKNTQASVASGSSTDNDMFLALIPSADKATTVASYSASSFAIPITSTTAVSTGGAISADVKFVLDNAEYDVICTNDTPGAEAFRAEVKPGTSDGTVFKIGGCVNPNADWSDFYSGGGSSIGLGVVFAFEKSAPTDVADDTYFHGYASGSAADVVTSYEAVAGGGGSGSGLIRGAGVKVCNTEAGVDYEIDNFSISHDYVITIADGREITGTKIANTSTSFSGTLETAVIDNTAHTIKIPANTYGQGALTSGVRYLKLKSASGDITIKLNCVA